MSSITAAAAELDASSDDITLEAPLPLDAPELTQTVDELSQTVDSVEGFITALRAARPYLQRQLENADIRHLLEISTGFLNAVASYGAAGDPASAQEVFDRSAELLKLALDAGYHPSVEIPPARPAAPAPYAAPYLTPVWFMLDDGVPRRGALARDLSDQDISCPIMWWDMPATAGTPNVISSVGTHVCLLSLADAPYPFSFWF